MKHFNRCLSACLLLALLLCCLTSCIDGDRAKGTIGDFLYAVEAGDFEQAEALLHPDRPADLAEYFNEIEAREAVDFQSGIEIQRFSGVRSAHYDSSVGGSAYETTAETTIGGKIVSITVEIVENDAGYGIYNFVLDF